MPLDSSILSDYRNHVYSLAVRIMGNREDAADVTQDVLVRLWERRNEVEEARRKAWTLRVTRNACLDALRRRQTRSRYTPSSDEEVGTSDTPLPDVLASSSEVRSHLEHALHALDEPYRSLIVLREIHDLAYTDIAETLDLSLTNVKVYLHRARKRMRESLQRTLPAEDLLSLS